jgi:hypothetical protein
MPSGLIEALTGVVAVLAIACAPVLYLRLRRGAAWRWFGLGIASWGVALVVKTLLEVPLEFLDLPAGVRGVASGLVSAAGELGMAAAFLRRRTLSVANVLAFGAGIGAFEVLFTLALWAIGVGENGGTAADVSSAMPVGLACLFYLVERAVTLVGHVASRVLVYVSLQARWLLPAGLAVAIFACVDGVASYGYTAEWDWDDVGVRALFMALITVLGTVEAGAAWLFWRRLSAWRMRTS